MIKYGLSVIVLFSVYCTCSYATQLIYTPNNPSFGGRSINGNYLLSNASSQNKHRAKRIGKEKNTPLEDFNERLQRSVLNRLTNSIASNFIDDSGKLIPGVTETEDFMIEVINLGDGMVSVITTEKLTGSSTTFIIESD